MTTINVNEAPKEPVVRESSSPTFNLSKSESDSITTVGIGVGTLILGYMAFNYLDSQGYIKQFFTTIGMNGSTGTVPTGASGGSESAIAYSYPTQVGQSSPSTIYARYSPDLTDITGDVEYKTHGQDSNLGAIEDPDLQYYEEVKGFGSSYQATVEHDIPSEIAGSYEAEEVVSYEAEELVPSDLSRYRVDRDSQGNLMDVSIVQ